MLRILTLALALAGVSSAAQAQAVDVVQVCGASSGVVSPVGPGGRLTRDVNGQLCTTGGGGGGGGSSVVTGSLEQDVRSAQTLNAATANAAITVPVNGQGTLGFTITGLTASGATLTFEQSEDGGTTWTIVNEVNAGTGVATSTRTTDGQTRIAASGRTNIRFRVSTVGTGTITIAYSLSVREGMVALTTPLPPGGNMIGSVLPGGLTRSRLTCTLPAYTAGGNIVCTNEAGAQTTTACAANTACLVNTANAFRKTAMFTNRTAGTTVDIGYSATVAPGTGLGIDGPGTSGGQGGSIEENPAHASAYYAASPAASTLVFVQGQ